MQLYFKRAPIGSVTSNPLLWPTTNRPTYRTTRRRAGVKGCYTSNNVQSYWPYNILCQLSSPSDISARIMGHPVCDKFYCKVHMVGDGRMDDSQRCRASSNKNCVDFSKERSLKHLKKRPFLDLDKAFDDSLHHPVYIDVIYLHTTYYIKHCVK